MFVHMYSIPTSSLSLLMKDLNMAWLQPLEEEDELVVVVVVEVEGGAGRDGMCLRWQTWAASSC